MTQPLSWLDDQMVSVILSYPIEPVTNCVYHVSTSDGSHVDHFSVKIGDQEVRVSAQGLTSAQDNKREAWLWLALRANAHRFFPYLAQAIHEGRKDWLVVEREALERLQAENATMRQLIDGALRKP